MQHELHIHSKDSDGAYTKVELLKIANEKGLDYISFTDHNTVDNLNSEVLNACYEKKNGSKNKSKIISGIEIDCFAKNKYHLLGYDLKIYNDLAIALNKLKLENHEICLEVIEKIRKNDNIELDVEEILSYQSSPYLSKSSIINHLVYLGIADNHMEASYYYVGKKSKNYIPRKKLSLKVAAKMVLDSGGIPIIAHPYRILMTNPNFKLEENIKNYKKMGIAGLESKTPSHSIEQEAYVKHLCKKNDMIYTGGSDYHSGNTNLIGSDDEDLIEGLLNYKVRRGR